MLRFSANLGFLWPDRPLLERIPAAATAGFKSVELHWPYDIPAADLNRVCRQSAVGVICLNTPFGKAGEYGLGALENREVEFSKGIDEAVGYAHAIGARAIHVMAGVVPETGNKRAMAVFAQNLELAARRAADLIVLLEPLNHRDRPGYFYSKVEEVAAMIARVGAANLRILFDVYHVGIAQGDVLTRLERHLPMIGHVQIAAVPGRAEPDEGEIAYGAIFAALERLGYDGWIGCEYHPRGATDDGLRWLENLHVSL